MKQKTTTASELLAEITVKALQGKKGMDIVVMDLRGVKGAITDFFVVCSGSSDRHVQALAYSVEETVLKDLREKYLNMEGYAQGDWILLDYVDVVVHVFQSSKREFYKIEDLWGDAKFKRYEDVL